VRLGQGRVHKTLLAMNRDEDALLFESLLFLHARNPNAAEKKLASRDRLASSDGARLNTTRSGSRRVSRTFEKPAGDELRRSCDEILKDLSIVRDARENLGRVIRIRAAVPPLEGTRHVACGCAQL